MNSLKKINEKKINNSDKNCKKDDVQYPVETKICPVNT